MSLFHFRNSISTFSRTASVLASLLGFWLAYPVHAGEDAMMLSFRGVRAYEDAHYSLAQSFFERAVRDALLKGQKEFAAMASANWVDVLLELGQGEKAQVVLNALGQVPESQLALVAWKRGQVLLSIGQTKEAQIAFDSALSKRPDAAWTSILELDRARAEWQGGQIEMAWQSALNKSKAARENLLPGWWSLLADISMVQGNYAQSDSLLELALKGYRERNRFARTTLLLWKQAACASAMGQKERSLRHLREALTIAGEIGVNPADLEKILARLIPPDSVLDIAKSPFGSDFDWQGENRDAIGEPKLEPQNAHEKSVSLPLDGSNPQ